MNCFYHPDKPAVATCTRCGKGLCADCAHKFEPVCCEDCAKTAIANERQAAQENKQTAQGSLLFYGAGIVLAAAISIVATIVLLVQGDSQWWMGLAYGLVVFAIAGTPAGWRFLSGITPNVFLWLPILGWCIYFLIKGVLAYLLGIVLFPMNAAAAYLNYKQVKNDETDIDRHVK